MSLQVFIEDLAAAGVAVTGHGEDVAVAHTAADGRIDAAQPGWQGSSAAALAAKTAQWAEDSRSLLAPEFWAHEQRSTQALNSLR
jgi:uncharacterized protein YukE